ncbi:Uncharacterised protein [Halioglobus japonicus]|nr:Uncharacterised protein [Halioglobus japonicus]
MTARRWIGILSIVVGGSISLAPAQAFASANESAPEDITLGSAGALVKVCTVAPSDADSSANLGFCYGFFEGAIRYHQALAGTNINRDLVCAPAGTTRQQGVEAFVSFMQENPQYESEASIDAVIRALAARWPCS